MAAGGGGDGDDDDAGGGGDGEDAMTTPPPAAWPSWPCPSILEISLRPWRSPFSSFSCSSFILIPKTEKKAGKPKSYKQEPGIACF
eukprot:4419034-Pyramimonas_sp.AAC.3